MPGRGVTRRLIVFILLFSSVITLLVTAIQLFDEYRNGVAMVRADIRQIEQLSLPSLTVSLWNLYDRQIQSQLDELVRFPSIRYLEIFHNGRLIASAGQPPRETEDFVDTIPMVYQSGEFQQLLGELRIHSTLDGVFQNLLDRVLIILVSNAAKTAVVSVFMFFLFRQLVTRHLDRISSYLQRFRLGQPDEPLQLERRHTGDEIDVLVDTLNRLMTSLDESTVSRDQLEERVAARTRELKDTQDELLRKGRLAVIGQLTATVSHELRNPLAVIRSSFYLINKRLAEQGDSKSQAAYERIDRNIDQCDRIIDELLDFTRVGKLEKQALDIDVWLASVLDEQPIPTNVELSRDFRLGDTEVEIDPSRLRRAVINLLDNAFQAIGDDRGHVRVETGTNADRIEIRVVDSGPGIPAEVMPNLFTALYSTKGFGIGLGMPVVKQIIEQHRGGIEVSNLAAGGASVTLWLRRGCGRKTDS